MRSFLPLAALALVAWYGALSVPKLESGASPPAPTAAALLSREADSCPCGASCDCAPCRCEESRSLLVRH